MTNKENYQFMKIKKVQNRDHQDINRNIDINFIHIFYTYNLKDGLIFCNFKIIDLHDKMLL